MNKKHKLWTTLIATVFKERNDTNSLKILKYLTNKKP